VPIIAELRVRRPSPPADLPFVAARRYDRKPCRLGTKVSR
jgi:hypothetical protein